MFAVTRANGRLTALSSRGPRGRAAASSPRPATPWRGRLASPPQALTAVVRLEAARPQRGEQRSHSAQQPLAGPRAGRGLGFGLRLRAEAEAEAADLAGRLLLAQKIGLHRERRHDRGLGADETAGQRRRRREPSFYRKRGSPALRGRGLDELRPSPQAGRQLEPPG